MRKKNEKVVFNVVSKWMLSLFCAFGFFSVSVSIWGTHYCGHIVDIAGNALPFATVYPIDTPVLGTVSNDSGYFNLVGSFHDTAQFVISFLGFKKQVLPAKHLASSDSSCKDIVLEEQPIALKETLVLTSQKHKSKKQKAIANTLYKVYLQMEKDFPKQPLLYHFVSDAAMQASSKNWGMEQLIAKAVVLPEKGPYIKNTPLRKDSVQFAPLACKRFFQPAARKQADTILSSEELNDNIRKFALGVDSGIILHTSFFNLGNPKSTFERYMDDIKQWKIEDVGNQQTQLTYTEKHNYIGILIYSYQFHFIVDSKSFRLQRFYLTGELKVNIPFGKKLDVTQLKILNLFNMSDKEIGKFRLRHFKAKALMNVFFTLADDILILREKNFVADVLISGTKKMEIPLHAQGTLKITQADSNGKPLNREEIKKYIKRQIVEVY